MLGRFLNYSSQGARLTLGFNTVEPWEYADMGLSSGAAKGQGLYSWGPHSFQAPIGDYKRRFELPQHLNSKAVSGTLNKAAAYLSPALSLGSTAYMIGTGFSENGLSGAKDALALDIAINAGVHSMYKVGENGVFESLAKRGVLSTTLMEAKVPYLSAGLRMAGTAKLYGGAAIGASIGQEMGGTPGAFLGGYLGARVGGLPTSMLLAAGATMYAGAQVAKMGATVIRAGYMKQQMRRRIDTAGSMASFMTQGAFTERERAVSAMHKSHLNARSALGSEANYMHLNRDYFSSYRRF